MAISQRRSRRKIQGGLYKPDRKKKKRELGRNPTSTKVGKKSVSTKRVMSGKKKTFLLSGNTVNVVGKDGKHIKAIIKTILENSANRHFVRRNIITKGAVVETDKGKARITSRPGQNSNLEGVLIE